MDTTLAFSLRKTLENIEGVSNNLDEFTGDLSSVVKGVQEGKGTLGGLINDSSRIALSFQQSLQMIGILGRNLNQITEELKLQWINSIPVRSGRALLNDPTSAEHLKKLWRTWFQYS